MSMEEIADQFFAAIENGDAAALERLYAEDVVVWHNFRDVTQSRAESVQSLAQFAAAATCKYIIEARYVVGDTVIQRHRVHVEMRETGETKDIAVAFFMTIRDGRVSLIHEYIDSADAVSETFE